MAADQSADEVEPKELAYYYPEPYWLAREGSWIKSLLLFFDGVAILLPEYMQGVEVASDPTLAGPLQDRGLLKVLQPEWFVDEIVANRIAEEIVELIAGGAFESEESNGLDFAALSMSRMGFSELSASRMGSPHSDVFTMIHEDLKERGLALDSEDGVSIRLRRDVRLVYLLLLAQEAREAGRRYGFDLHPTTNFDGASGAMRSFLELPPMPSRNNVISFDLQAASVDLEIVPLDEVLDFRLQNKTDHRAYMLNLRQFLLDIASAQEADRSRLIAQREVDLAEQARSLLALAIDAFKTPVKGVGFALGLTGAAWTVATAGIVPGVLSALGASSLLLPDRSGGSAYSYIFQAHRQWPGN